MGFADQTWQQHLYIPIYSTATATRYYIVARQLVTKKSAHFSFCDEIPGRRKGKSPVDFEALSAVVRKLAWYRHTWASPNDPKIQGRLYL